MFDMDYKNFENFSNEELLHLYRLLYKNQIGELSDWKKIEKEILSRMEISK
jgi:hypothetical protein